jgi:hypothetical protein
LCNHLAWKPTETPQIKKYCTGLGTIGDKTGDNWKEHHGGFIAYCVPDEGIPRSHIGPFESGDTVSSVPITSKTIHVSNVSPFVRPGGCTPAMFINLTNALTKGCQQIMHARASISGAVSYRTLTFRNTRPATQAPKTTAAWQGAMPP